MTNDLTINQTPEGYFNVYCNECGRQVDNVTWERGVRYVRSIFWRDHMVPAGFATVTIQCHGETFVRTVS